MEGGLGDDVYSRDNAGDVIVELAGQGTDRVHSSLDYTLTDNVENLTLVGSAAIDGTGNALDNVIIGNDGDNALRGGAGNDTLRGGSGDDTLVGHQGADRMEGGLGDDVYSRDNAGDVIVELAGQGTDRVHSSLDYTLTDNVENLTLVGSAAIDGTGNALDNVIIGNDGDNALRGGAGNDTLRGGSGDDTLVGHQGADRMEGGLGDDVYSRDNAGDVIVELAGQGTDRVHSSLDYTLTDNVENLTLVGSAAIDGTGNALDNVIIGNDGDNALRGGAGNDTLRGGSGDDTLVGHQGADRMEGGLGDDVYSRDNAGDVIVELAGQGTDRVHSSLDYTLTDNVENLTLVGSAAIDGTGNALDNVIIGNAAANALRGGLGADSLTGGGDDDVFVFLSTETHRWQVLTRSQTLSIWVTGSIWQPLTPIPERGATRRSPSSVPTSSPTPPANCAMTPAKSLATSMVTASPTWRSRSPTSRF